MLQRWRAVGKTMSDLADPGLEPLTSRSRNERERTNWMVEWFCRYGWLRKGRAGLRVSSLLCYLPELKYKLNSLYLIMYFI